MNSRSLFLMLAFMSTMLPAGCSQPSWEERTYEIREISPLDQARQLLEGYAGGQPLGSEVDSYPDLVSRLREVDPAKADVLEQGLEELSQSSGSLQVKAKALLEKL
jgi:hypothetical protein